MQAYADYVHDPTSCFHILSHSLIIFLHILKIIKKHHSSGMRDLRKRLELSRIMERPIGQSARG